MDGDHPIRVPCPGTPTRRCGIWVWDEDGCCPACWDERNDAYADEVEARRRLEDYENKEAA